jgi:hypothetical protein
MLTFTTTAPTQQQGRTLDIVRTPAPGAYQAIVTCEQMVGCPTHFFHGRTLPCQEPDCPACDEGTAWRWHGYVTCLNTKTNEHQLFEMTAQASEEFKTYNERHGTLRGCQFHASRAGGRTNGRVNIRTKPIDLKTLTLPKAPDLIKCLCHLWNINTPDVEVNGTCKDLPKLNVKKPEPRIVQ